jgi:hypothetical protein
MMRTRIIDWFNHSTFHGWLCHSALHGTMDLALEITELNIYSYGGENGADDLTADIADAYDAVESARHLAPVYTHANLDRAMRHIDAALNNKGEVDVRLGVMAEAALLVRRAHQSLLVRHVDYREMELVR